MCCIIIHSAVLLVLCTWYQTLAERTDNTSSSSLFVTSTGDHRTSTRTPTLGQDPLPATDPAPYQDDFAFVSDIQPVRLSGPWNDVKNLFDDFESEIVAINSAFCGPACRFQTILKPSKEKGRCDECSCSENCLQSGDCCPDLVLLYNKTQQTAGYPGCVGNEIPSTRDSEYHLMVIQCPDFYNVTSIKTYCEQPSNTDWADVVPHFHSEISFRNIHCAQCHGYNDTRSWPTSITCSSFDNSLQQATSLLELFNATMKSKACRIQFTQPSLDMRSCNARHGGVIASCNITGQWQFYDERIVKACSMFSHVVNGTYKNIFCYLCNTRLHWRFVLELRGSSRSQQPMSASLTALIDFSNTLEAHTSRSSQATDLQSMSNSTESKTAYLEQVGCFVDKFKL